MGVSSIGDGVTSALLLKPILRSHFALAFFARILKLYVFPIESAFEYSHQLNRNESSNGFHILRSHFALAYFARILKLYDNENGVRLE